MLDPQGLLEAWRLKGDSKKGVNGIEDDGRG
jgi:hypothetical protein